MEVFFLFFLFVKNYKNILWEKNVHLHESKYESFFARELILIEVLERKQNSYRTDNNKTDPS